MTLAVLLALWGDRRNRYRRRQSLTPREIEAVIAWREEEIRRLAPGQDVLMARQALLAWEQTA